MKTVKLLFLVTLLTLATVSVSNAQKNYNTAIGVRFSDLPGVTFKHFVSGKSAFEAILHTRWHGFMLTGLYEIHQSVFSEPGFNFYYGFGGHIGSWNVGRYDHPWYDGTGTHTAFGIDGILGLEYSFREIPLNLSIDWKPFLNLDDFRPWANDVGFSVRVYF